MLWQHPFYSIWHLQGFHHHFLLVAYGFLASGSVILLSAEVVWSIRCSFSNSDGLQIFLVGYGFDNKAMIKYSIEVTSRKWCFQYTLINERSFLVSIVSGILGLLKIKWPKEIPQWYSLWHTSKTALRFPHSGDQSIRLKVLNNWRLLDWEGCSLLHSGCRSCTSTESRCR